MTFYTVIWIYAIMASGRLVLIRTCENRRRWSMFRHKRVIGFRVELVVEPDDVGFHAYCPALKGLHTCGDTEQEALQNARDAAVAYLQTSIKYGDPIPIGILIHEEDEWPHAVSEGGMKRHTEDLAVPCAT
jgi:predicted RNase H-like HicB family nuclease